LRTMMAELPESAAHAATDPNRVYYLGAGYNPCHAPGAPFFLTRPCLRPCPSLRTPHDMLDGLRQGLVRSVGEYATLVRRAGLAIRASLQPVARGVEPRDLRRGSHAQRAVDLVDGLQPASAANSWPRRPRPPGHPSSLGAVTGLAAQSFFYTSRLSGS